MVSEEGSVHGAWPYALGQSIMAGETCGRGFCSLLSRQEAESGRGKGSRIIHHQRPAPSNLLPPAMSHLLNFPEPPEIVPLAEDQASKTRVPCETFHFQIVTFCPWLPRTRDHLICKMHLVHLPRAPRVLTLQTLSKNINTKFLLRLQANS
jgi:hypothetical protein